MNGERRIAKALADGGTGTKAACLPRQQEADPTERGCRRKSSATGGGGSTREEKSCSAGPPSDVPRRPDESRSGRFTNRSLAREQQSFMWVRIDRMYRLNGQMELASAEWRRARGSVVGGLMRIGAVRDGEYRCFPDQTAAELSSREPTTGEQSCASFSV